MYIEAGGKQLFVDVRGRNGTRIVTTCVHEIYYAGLKKRSLLKLNFLNFEGEYYKIEFESLRLCEEYSRATFRS